LRVYLPSSAPNNDCRGALYQDDGHTFAYQKGKILRVNYSCQVSSEGVMVSSNIENNAYQPWWKSVDVTIYGAAAPKEVRIGEQTIHNWRYDSSSHTITFTVPDALKNWSVRFAF